MSTLRSEVECLAIIVESDALAMTYQTLGQYRRDLLEVIQRALALPEPTTPDQWMPASEPPETARQVLVAHRTADRNVPWAFLVVFYRPSYGWQHTEADRWREIYPPEVS